MGGADQSYKVTAQELASHPQLVFQHLWGGGRGGGREDIEITGSLELKTGPDIIGKPENPIIYKDDSHINTFEFTDLNLEWTSLRFSGKPSQI